MNIFIEYFLAQCELIFINASNTAAYLLIQLDFLKALDQKVQGGKGVTEELLFLLEEYLVQSK